VPLVGVLRLPSHTDTEARALRCSRALGPSVSVSPPHTAHQARPSLPSFPFAPASEAVVTCSRLGGRVAGGLCVTTSAHQRAAAWGKTPPAVRA